jgi:hypothetical protein
MATYHAISVVCQAVTEMLRAQFTPDVLGGQNADFKVALAPELSNRAQNPAAGVTLYLYRIDQNNSLRNTPIRLIPEEGRKRPKLTIDLAFLLTAWASEAAIQQDMVGWMLSTMSANPLLTGAMLNQVKPGTFQPDEVVEVIPTVLSNAEIHQIWEGISRVPYFLSIPYLARNIAIETFV